jgi:preprotein translocase subunit SecE
MSRSKRTTTRADGTEYDPSRWAHASFVLGGFMVGWMSANLIEDMWAFIWSQWPQYVGRPSTMWSNVAAVVVALIATFWAWRKDKYFRFISEVATEVSQIIWPTRSETRAATVVVVVITLICSGLLFGMDQFWSTFTSALYDL